MTSGHSPAQCRRKGSFTDKRALIACTHCRRIKKKCKPGGSAGCRRCDATGKVCRYVNVDGTSSSYVPGSPLLAPPILVETEHEDTSNASPFLLADAKYTQQPQSQCPYLVSINSQQVTLESSYSLTQAQYISNSLHDTPSDFCYASNPADQAAHQPLAQSYDFDGQQVSNEAPSSHGASMSMVGVKALSSTFFAPTTISFDDEYIASLTQPPFHLNSQYEEAPLFPSGTCANASANTISSNRYTEPSLELLTSTSTSGPCAPYGALSAHNSPTTSNQDTSTSTFNPCSVCRPGHRCVVHFKKSDYH